MNTYDDNDRNDLRYAEYVLGVLDADARAAVEREIASGDAAATAVALWQRRLVPLAEELSAVEPPTRVWSRVRQELRLDALAPTPARARTRPSLWENLRLWHWVGLGASAVAAACLVVMLTHPRTPPASSVASSGLMVSSIKQDNGIAGWTATMDLQRKQILVLPATPAAIAANRSTELWLIPAGHAPISIGVFKPDAADTLPLSPALLAQLGPTASLAVSVEPLGGSPTHQPTGPVIAHGAISGAPAPTAPSGLSAWRLPDSARNAG